MPINQVPSTSTTLKNIQAPVKKEEKHDAKKTSSWNRWTVSIVVVGGISLVALSVYLYNTGTLYKSAKDNVKVPIHKNDYFCREDAGELYKYGASSFEGKSTHGGYNEPACLTSVLAPFCKWAVEKMCKEKGDVCTNVEVTGIHSEHGRDLLCYTKATSNDCEETFRPVGSSFWSWLDVEDFNGWKNNPVVTWARQLQSDSYKEQKISFKTRIECPKNS